MNTYTQLTQEQRYQIKALMDIGHNQTEVAQQLEVNKSSISREVERNRGQRGYRPKQAHEIAFEKAARKGTNEDQFRNLGTGRREDM